MLTEEPVLDQGPGRINFVDNRVGIPIVTSSEDCNFVVQICGSETFMQVRSAVNSLFEHTVFTAW